jgi:single-stranded DNA-binding protein
MTKVISSRHSGKPLRPDEERLGEIHNAVFLLGRLCHSPGIHQLHNGRTKVAFRMAVPRITTRDHARVHHRGNGGHVDYATVIVLGQKACELQALGLPRGAWVSVHGRLQTWDNGKWEIVAQSVEPDQIDVA